jgi:hypothetical protein
VEVFFTIIYKTELAVRIQVSAIQIKGGGEGFAPKFMSEYQDLVAKASSPNYLDLNPFYFSNG